MPKVHDAAPQEARRTVMGTFSDHAITREYYRRTYPRGFRYIYATLLKKMLREPTPYKLEYAANLLESMLERRTKELDLLPDWPYFNKFLRRLDSSRVPRKSAKARPSRLLKEKPSTSEKCCCSTSPPSTSK